MTQGWRRRTRRTVDGRGTGCAPVPRRIERDPGVIRDVWNCRACGSNNLLDACWSCHAPPGAADDDVAPSAAEPAQWPQPPGTPPPSWPPPPIPPLQRRSSRTLVAVGLLAVAGVVAGVVGLGHVVGGLFSPSAALAAPTSIEGLPRVTGQDPAAASLGALHVVDVVSATYGSGDVRYTVIAISTAAVLGGRATIVQAVGPQVVGDAGLDDASRTSVDRDGATFTCWRMTGDVAGALCSWSADSVTGEVIQVGSADIGRAIDFTVHARQGIEHR